MTDPLERIPEALFGFVEIKDECGVRGCHEAAVAAFPYRSPPEESGVWWLCAEHTDTIPSAEGETGSHAGGRAQEITYTCRVGHEVPCGAAATHVAVIGFRDEQGTPELAIVSVCPRHAETFGDFVGTER